MISRGGRRLMFQRKGQPGSPGASRGPGSVARRAGPVQGIMLLLPITMAVMGISVLTAVVPAMQQHFHALPNSDYLVGIVMTMPAVWILLFSPIAGWLADRVGRRALLVGAMVAYAFIGIAPAFVDDIYLIIGLRCGLGICEAVVLTVSTTMISDYFKGPERTNWMANQMMVASISAMPIFWLGGQLGAAYGWRGPFYLYAYSLPLTIGILCFTWEPDGTVSEAAPNVGSEPVLYHKFPWPRMSGICLLTVLASILFYAVITQNGNALGALGVSSPAKVGTFTMLASVGVPVGALCLRALGRIHVGWLLALDFLLLGAGLIGMSRATDPNMYVRAALLHQIACGMVVPTLLVWATHGLAFNVRGRGTGMWTSAFAIGQFVSSLVIIYASKQLHGVLMSFALLGQISLSVAAALIIAQLIIGGPTALIRLQRP